MSPRSTRRRPAWPAALLVLVLAVVVSACGGDEETADPSTAKASGEITVWAPGVEGEKLPELAKDFEQANPGVKVKVTPVAIEQAHNKILTSIAGNQTPDIAPPTPTATCRSTSARRCACAGSTRSRCGGPSGA